MKPLFLVICLSLVGCGPNKADDSTPRVDATTLKMARERFTTRIVRTERSYDSPELPPAGELDLIYYSSPVGKLAAYLTPDPGDGRQHPAIVWITGGDTNTIGDVWTAQPRSNDQSALAFRTAGVITMYPSQRGGNDNPGQREGFYGEVDDIIAATDFLVSLPYVDSNHVFLGGHSTGGTMAMLVGEYTDRYRAVFALGPVADTYNYGSSMIYCDPASETELDLRSPLLWLHCVERPMFVFEGANDGNWDSIELMQKENVNSKIHFYRIPGQDHFSIIAPLTELLAQQIVSGEGDIAPKALRKYEKM